MMELAGDALMKWPACSSEFNLTGNLRSIMEKEMFKDDKYWSYKETFWKAIQDHTWAVRPFTMKTLSESTNNLVFQVIQ